MKSDAFAAAQQKLRKIGQFGDNFKPTSATDFSFRAFTEQLHRIADQLSKDIESGPSFASVISLCPHAIE
jgi:hypothetical protein